MPELPRFRMKIVIIVLVLLVLMVTVGWLYLLASLPKTIGTVSVAGLDGQVEIVRDKNGVPHIFASTDNDAFFALGYVHAQDRISHCVICPITKTSSLSVSHRFLF